MPDKPFALSAKVMILDKQGRCLLLRRSSQSKANAGMWDLPGGKVDAGETFDKALLREVAEETGLTISLERVLGASESVLSNCRVAYIILEGRIKTGKIHLSDEHDKCQWVDPSKLTGIDICPQFEAFVMTYSQANSV
jgi:8-oxo-dGTP diphosphatase